jgi:hypothetical protein
MTDSPTSRRARQAAIRPGPEWQRLFHQCDRDQNGFLSAGEVRAAAAIS